VPGVKFFDVSGVIHHQSLIEMAAIVQRLERLIVVQDVVGSNPTSRPIFFTSNSQAGAEFSFSPLAGDV
jgi:hypothetical protein